MHMLPPPIPHSSRQFKPFHAHWRSTGREENAGLDKGSSRTIKGSFNEQLCNLQILDAVHHK